MTTKQTDRLTFRELIYIPVAIVLCAYWMMVDHNTEAQGGEIHEGAM